MFAIDDAMGDVVTRATEPALGAIKLAWWRERLQELDQGKVPAEPRLQAAADKLLPRGIAGASLAELEEGWATLLDAEPEIERAGTRGACLFDMASSLLGASDSQIQAAGRLYAMAGARRRGLLEHWPTAEINQLAGHRFVREVRPLTMLAALAARDSKRDSVAEPEGTPGRALALVQHRITGRVG